MKWILINWDWPCIAICQNVGTGDHIHSEFKFPYKVVVWKWYAIEREVATSGFLRLHWKQTHVSEDFTSVFVEIQLHYLLPLLPLLRTHLHSKENQEKKIYFSLMHTHTRTRTHGPCRDLVTKRHWVVACWVSSLNIYIFTHSLSNFSWVSMGTGLALDAGRHTELNKTYLCPQGGEGSMSTSRGEWQRQRGESGEAVWRGAGSRNHCH